MRAMTIVLFALLLGACDTGDGGTTPDTSPEGLRNMAATQEGGAQPSGKQDKEPNDAPAQAVSVQLSEGQAQLEGVLTKGAADKDFYLLPASLAPGVVQVSVTPAGAHDVLVGVMARQGDTIDWFDNELGGGNETVPNLRIGSQGTWVVVAARGDTDVAYRVDVTQRATDVLTEAEPNDDVGQEQQLVVG